MWCDDLKEDVLAAQEAVNVAFEHCLKWRKDFIARDRSPGLGDTDEFRHIQFTNIRDLDSRIASLMQAAVQLSNSA